MGSNENELYTSSIQDADSEDSGILTATSSDSASDSSYTDSDYLSAIYETSVQSVVIQFAILVLVIIYGFARLMNKFFE